MCVHDSCMRCPLFVCALTLKATWYSPTCEDALLLPMTNAKRGRSPRVGALSQRLAKAVVFTTRPSFDIMVDTLH